LTRAVQALSAEAALPAILSLGAALRMAHLVALRSSPFFAGLGLDHRYYDQWAQAIAHGEAKPGVFFVDPLYAYFLAGIYRVLGHDLLWPRVAQLLLGIGTCYLAARIGRRVLGSVARGNLVALGCALFAPAIFYEGEIEKTALGVFLFTLAVELFLRGSRRFALASGLALGAAVLARGNLLVFAPIGAALLAVEGFRARREWLSAVLFAGGVLVAVAPATVHNYRAEHTFVLSTANFGQNFFLGQNHENTSGSYQSPAFVRPDPAYEESDFKDEAERRGAHLQGASAASAYWASEARAEIAQAPGTALIRTWRKFRLFWHQFETPDSENIELVADYSWVLGLPLLWFGWLVPFALLGAIVSARQSRDARVLIGIILAYSATVLGIFVLARFRAPIVPLLSVFAAGGVVWLERERRVGERRVFFGGVALCGAALIFTTFYPDALEQERRSSLAIAYHNLAETLTEHGDTAGALHAHEQAVKTDDSSVPASLRELGEIYLKRGDYARAEHMMKRVLELKPDSRRAQDALNRLRAATGQGPLADAPAASADPSSAGPTGAAARVAEFLQKARDFRKQEQWPQAIEALEGAIRVGPYDENQHYQLGSWMEAHGTPESLISYWSEDVKNDPKPQTGYYYWAVGLERSGDDAAALAKLAQALDIDPAHEMSELRWAQILERQGKHAPALEHCQNATRIFPDYQSAHETCAKILQSLGRSADAAHELELAKSSNPNTPRRFFFWARYLAEKGRTAAAVTELRRALAQNPNDAEARALLDKLAPGSGADELVPGSGADARSAALSDSDRTTLLTRLRTEPAGTPVWFVVSKDAGANDLAQALSQTFTAAGWVVKGVKPSPFPLKPQLYLFAAEDNPPSYVETVRAALEAIGKPPTVGRGYRAYYADRIKENPSYAGFEFGEGQTYLIAIGRQGKP